MSAARITLGISMVWITAALIVVMLLYPQPILQAALTGVGIWWDVLFPALFPFFIITELLLSYGIVHFFGTLLDPLMRPLFRVPGIGGFVMAMGFASGYPVGARLTSQLYDQKLVNSEEGERLVAFTSTSDPIFLIGAVSIGFFHSVEIALILGLAHYSTGILIGLLMRFYARKQAMTPASGVQEGSLLLSAFRNMHRARLEHHRPFGEMLQEAVLTALRLIFVIGGLVVFFSVLIEILTQTKILQSLGEGISRILHISGMPGELADAFINGLFEVTLGAKAAGAAGADLRYRAAAAAFILSWAGLSVHAQIISLMSHTGMRYLPFLLARLLHGVLAMGVVFLLWHTAGPHAAIIQSWAKHFAPVASLSPGSLASKLPHTLFLISAVFLMTLVVLSLTVHGMRRIYHLLGKSRL